MTTTNLLSEPVSEHLRVDPTYAAAGADRRLGRRFRDLLPSVMMFTPFTHRTQKLWERAVKVDTSVTHPPRPIPEIDGERYSFESLKAATNNFKRQPVVVRGLFKDSPAVEKWATTQYLPSTPIGDLVLPVIKDGTYGTVTPVRENMSFRDAFLDVVEHQAQKYVFFPVKSRFEFDEFNSQALDRMAKAVNDLVRTDLDLERIRPGFGGPKHRQFVGAQMIIGHGHRTPEKTTGTGWHCAFSNNFFVQVAGRKRWYFLSPEYSRYLFPMRHGVNTMMTGSKYMGEIQHHLPVSFVDLDAGDMLYNPYWQWHTVMNYEGLSIGVPIREKSVLLARRNSRLFTNIALVNNLALRVFRRDIGGYGDH